MGKPKRYKQMDRDTGPLRNLALGLLLGLWVTLSDGGGLLGQPGSEEKRAPV